MASSRDLTYFVIFVVIVFVQWAVASHQSASKKAVIGLKTEDNLNKVLQNEYSFVVFYANWCPHCTHFEPTLEDASKLMKKSELNGKFVIAKIDCASGAKAQKVCDAHKINGFPTVKIFHKNKPLEMYMGPRTAGGITSYMEKVVKTGKAQFVGGQTGAHQNICLAKDYKKYVAHKQ